jgi:ABC-type glycerol-3-phosphate transport system substrate-binding protein
MRKILCFVLTLLMAAALIGCSPTQAPAAVANTPEDTSAGASGSEPAASGQAEKKVLRIAGESWQITKLFLEEAAAAFEKDHPDVTVEVQTYADPTVVSNYAIDWASGSTPVDIVVIDGAQFVQQFVAKDLIYDFEKDLNFFSDYDVSKFVPSALDMSRIDGNLYVIPLICELTVVNVNTKMFRDAGLVDAQGNALAPTTWKEFHEFAQKLTIKDNSGVVTQQGAVIQWNKDMHGTVLGVLQAINGTIYGSDGVSIDFNNDGFRNVFDTWKAGVADGSFSTETFSDTEAGRNGYKAGKVAMLIESSGRWVEAGNEFGFENVSVFPLPGGKGTAGYVNGVFIPKCSEATDLAQQFIKEQLLGEYVQTNTLNQYGKLPVISEYFDMANSPDWTNIKAAVASACTYPAYQDSSKLLDEMRSIIQEGLANADSTDTTIQNLQDMIGALRK